MAERDFTIRIKAEINDAQKALDDLRKRMVDAFGGASKEAESFSAEGQKIVDTLNDVKEAAKAINVYKTVGEDFKETAKAVRENKKEIDNLSSSIGKTKKELEEAAEAEKALAASKLIEHYVKLQTELTQLGASLTAAKQKMKEAEQSVGSFSRELEEAKNTITSVRAAAKALGQIDEFQKVATQTRETGKAFREAQSNLNAYSAEVKQSKVAMAALEAEMEKMKAAGDKAGLKAAKEDLTQLRKELKAAESGYGSAQKEVISLSGKFDTLKAKTKGASDQLKAMGIDTSKLSAEKKRLQIETEKTSRSIAEITVDLKTAQGAYLTTANDTTKLIQQNDKLTVSFDKAGEALTEIGIDTGKAAQAQAEFTQRAQASERSVSELEKELKALQAGYKTAQSEASRLTNTQEVLRQKVKQSKVDMADLGVDTKKLVAEEKRLEEETRRAALAFNEFKTRASGMVAIEQAFKQVSTAARKTGEDAKQALQRVQTGTSSLGSAMGSLKNQIIAAFSIYAVYNFGKELVNTQIQVEGLTMAFKQIFGTAEDGAKQFDWLRETTRKYGLELYSTADSYKQFAASSKAAGMATEETQNTFEGVTTAIAALRLPTESANRVFYAMSQMMAKGKVSAEELRQQMGESLPGATAYAAKAMGMTTAAFEKAMATGKIMSDEFLPRFAKVLRDEFGGSATDAADSLQGAFNRMATAWVDFKVELSQGAFADEIGGLFEDISTALKSDSFRENAKAMIIATMDLTKSLYNAGVEIAKIGEQLHIFDMLKTSLDMISSSGRLARVEMYLLREQTGLIINSQRELNDLLERGIITYDEQTKTYSDNTQAVLNQTDALSRANRETSLTIGKMSELEDALKKGVVVWSATDVAYRDNAELLQKVRNETGLNIETANQYLDAINNHTIALDEQAGKYYVVADAIKKVEDEKVKAQESALTIEMQIMQEWSDYMSKAHGETIDGIVSKYDELEKEVWKTTDEAKLAEDERSAHFAASAAADIETRIAANKQIIATLEDLGADQAQRINDEKTYYEEMIDERKRLLDELSVIESENHKKTLVGIEGERAEQIKNHEQRLMFLEATGKKGEEEYFRTLEQIDAINTEYDVMKNAIIDAGKEVSKTAEDRLKKALELAEQEKREKVDYYDKMLREMENQDQKYIDGRESAQKKYTEEYKRAVEARTAAEKAGSARRAEIEKAYIAELTSGQKNASDNLKAIQSRIDELVQKRTNLMSADERAAIALKNAMAGLSSEDTKYYQSAMRSLSATEQAETSYRQFSGANETLARMRIKMAEGTDKMSEAELKVATSIVESVSAIGKNLEVEGQRQKIMDDSKSLLGDLYNAQQKIEEAKLDKAKDEVDSFKQRLEEAKQTMIEMANKASEDMELKLDTQKAKAELDGTLAQYGEVKQGIEADPIKPDIDVSAFTNKISAMKTQYNELKKLIEEKNQALTEFKGKASPEKPLSETIQDVSGLMDGFREKANSTNTSTTDFGDTSKNAADATGAMSRYSESAESASNSSSENSDAISSLSSDMSGLAGVTAESSTNWEGNTKSQKENSTTTSTTIELTNELGEILKSTAEAGEEMGEAIGGAMDGMAIKTSKYIELAPKIVQSIEDIKQAAKDLGYAFDTSDMPQADEYLQQFSGPLFGFTTGGDWEGYGQALEAYRDKQLAILQELMEKEQALSGQQKTAADAVQEAATARLNAQLEINASVDQERDKYNELIQTINEKKQAVIDASNAETTAINREINDIGTQTNALMTARNQILSGIGYEGDRSVISDDTQQERDQKAKDFAEWQKNQLADIAQREAELNVSREEAIQKQMTAEQEKADKIAELNAQQAEAQDKLRSDIQEIQSGIQPFNDSIATARSELQSIVDALNELKSSNDWSIALDVFLKNKDDFLSKVQDGNGLTIEELLASLSVTGMATGGEIFKRYPSGRLPGPDSKRDSVPVLARQGEWFIHNEAVSEWKRKLGDRFMYAINAPWSGLGRSLLQRVRGYADGGEVAMSAASMTSSGGDWQPSRKVEIQFKANNGQQVNGYFNDSDTDRLIDILKTAQMRAV